MSRGSKSAVKKLESLINEAYRVHGNCVEIKMSDLSKVFAAGREAAAKGESIEAAVAAAIARYRTNTEADTAAGRARLA